MDTNNQIQALDSTYCSRNLIEMRVQILGPVQWAIVVVSEIFKPVTFNL